MTATTQALDVPAPSVGASPAEEPTGPRRARSWPRPSTTTLLAVGGFSALALALWVPALGSRYWIDEALSIGIAEEPLLDIPGTLAQDGSPPLWYLLLHVWVGVFGSSELSTHVLSTLFAVAAVPVAWWAANRLAGRSVAVVATALVALSPFLAYFAHETRMYTLAAVLALALAACHVGAFVDRDRRSLVGFVVVAVALLYTHNWGIYTLGAAAVAVVPAAWLHAPGVERKVVWRWAAAAFGIVAVAYLPWVPTLLGQLRDTGAPWSFTPGPRQLVRELAALVRDERVLLVLGVAAGGGLLSLRARLRSRDATVAVILGLLAGLPVLAGWLAAQVEPSWATRYLAVVVGPLLLLVGIGLVRAGTFGTVALAVTAVLILQPFTRIEGNLHHPVDAKSNAADVADEFGTRVEAGDVVVVAQPEAVPLLSWYLGDEPTYADPNGVVAEPGLMDWRGAGERLAGATVETGLEPLVDAMAPGSRLLLVVPGGPARSTDTGWVSQFRLVGAVWQLSLMVDDRLVRVDRLLPAGPTETPFDAVLFVRR